MPADTLTISLTGPLADEVRAAAEASDLSPEAWAQQALAAWLQSWEEDYRRLAEPGGNVPLDVIVAVASAVAGNAPMTGSKAAKR